MELSDFEKVETKIYLKETFHGLLELFVEPPVPLYPEVDVILLLVEFEPKVILNQAHSS